MNRESAKKALKIAVIAYLVSFFVFNWNDVSWIFNYRVVYGIANDFFNPYPSIESEEISALFFPNYQENINSTPQTIDYKSTFTEKQKTLEIPKLGLQLPIVFPKTTDNKIVTKSLDSGVVYYPGSVLPAEKGQIVILGHSSPEGWPKIKYDWAFDDLDELSPGDYILIHLDNRQYKYRVRETVVINKGDDLPKSSALKNSNTLVLVTCWPPGKDSKRMVVIAELKN